MTVSRETKLTIYRELLLKWGGSLNLSSARDSDHEGFDHHIADSLSLLPHLPPNLVRLIDLGSGQGFPAIPVAIFTGVAVDLIESDRRKAAFLTTAMAKLDINGRVLASRIEATELPLAACVTARALAPLSRLLPLAKPFLAPDGCCLFLKGPAAEKELAEAGQSEMFAFDIFPTPSPRSKLVRITKLR